MAEYNEEYVIFCLKQNGENIIGMIPEIRKNKKFIKIALENGACLGFIDEEFRNDKEIMLHAIKQNPRNYEYANHTLRMDPDIRRALGKED